MPAGDRTGPLGLGPRTGRGMGFCSGSTQPGYSYLAPRYFGWCRMGRGGGRGYRNRFFATGLPGWVALTPEQETNELKAQADWLKTQLDVIEKRIEELEKK